ncbi:hypothetical protein FA15DRAFT_758308 [Coprinopsis marcescibilis]|uniref:F-box domain-containing protein n=1 Tax=Coprinopsis marcescibilis TaxID=230819 RepID=A0A5C3KNJ8_COPMA|nr:hypothetical protein FA15DRAFT_758308 [Coprinopsis marcescibilis]
MFMKDQTSPLSRLPTELYNSILEFLDRPTDLLNICRCCKLLCSEGQRILYHTVQLKGAYRLILFAKTILSNPSLGNLVHALAIPTRAFLSPSDRDKVRQAIQRLPCLQALYIKHSMTRYTLVGYLEPDMLEGCTRELEIFHSELDYQDGSVQLDSPFFQLHPRLNHIYLGWTNQVNVAIIPPRIHLQQQQQQQPSHPDPRGHEPSQTCLPGTFLPHLQKIHLETLDLLPAFVDCPLRCIRINRISMSPRSVEKLERTLQEFSGTLTNISLRINQEPPGPGQGPEKASVSDLLRAINRAAPNLQFLNLCGEVALHSESEPFLTNFLSTLSILGNLTTLMLDTSQPAYRRNDWHRYLDNLLSCKESCRLFAQRFFDALPFLQRVVFGPLGTYGPGRYWVKDCVGCPSFLIREKSKDQDQDTEAAGGEMRQAVLEGFGLFGDDSWAVL